MVVWKPGEKCSVGRNKESAVSDTNDKSCRRAEDSSLDSALCLLWIP